MVKGACYTIDNAIEMQRLFSDEETTDPVSIKLLVNYINSVKANEHLNLKQKLKAIIARFATGFFRRVEIFEYDTKPV